MKRYFILLIVCCAMLMSSAQNLDTLGKSKDKKMNGLIGLDVYSALSPLSIMGGVQKRCHAFVISISHWSRSSRFGIYYNYTLNKKHQILLGLGYHESYLFYRYKQSREEYLDYLLDNNYHLSTINVAFYPGSRYEVRHQHFFSFSLSKVFKLYQGFFLNVRASGIYGVNDYYGHREFRPIAGIQLYYKW